MIDNVKTSSNDWQRKHDVNQAGVKVLFYFIYYYEFSFWG